MRVQCWKHFQRGRKIGAVKNISPSSGDKCFFHSKEIVKKTNAPKGYGEAPAQAGGQNESFPGPPLKQGCSESNTLVG